MKVITIGKKNNPWIEQGITVYQQRLRRPFLLDWTYIPHQPIASKAIDDESTKILQHCPDKDFVILLDETGQQLNSLQLSAKIQTIQTNAQPITFIIGGAFGVNQTVKDRADFMWSLSPLVFPHQLVRLLLTEQLYRAQSIALGEPYHHQ